MMIRSRTWRPGARARDALQRISWATPRAAAAAAGAESGACGQATLSQTAAPQSTAAVATGDEASMLLVVCSVFFSLDPTDVGSVCVFLVLERRGAAALEGELERRAVQNSKLWFCIVGSGSVFCRCDRSHDCAGGFTGAVVEHPLRLSEESPSRRHRDVFATSSRRDHYGGFMNPSFEAFVDPSDGSHDKPGTPSNREGQYAPPEAWIVNDKACNLLLRPS